MNNVINILIQIQNVNCYWLKSFSWCKKIAHAVRNASHLYIYSLCVTRIGCLHVIIIVEAGRPEMVMSRASRIVRRSQRPKRIVSGARHVAGQIGRHNARPHRWLEQHSAATTAKTAQRIQIATTDGQRIVAAQNILQRLRCGRIPLMVRFIAARLRWGRRGLGFGRLLVILEHWVQQFGGKPIDNRLQIGANDAIACTDCVRRGGDVKLHIGQFHLVGGLPLI